MTIFEIILTVVMVIGLVGSALRFWIANRLKKTMNYAFPPLYPEEEE